MLKLVAVSAAVLLSMSVYAQAATCKVQATEKKLAGAAMTSFMTKCEKDAKASCTKAAVDKKLAGAAKDSNVKKCVTDSVGS